MKKAILSIFILMTLFACSNDDSSTNNNDDDGGSGGDNLSMTFKANGTSYSIEPYSTSSGGIFTIHANEGLDADYRGISLSMPENFTTGSHNIVDSFESDQYTAIYSEGDILIDAVSGTLTITSITNEFVEGTFNFTGETNEGDTYNITEGSFRSYNIE